jgi:hypothetical protein
MVTTKDLKSLSFGEFMIYSFDNVVIDSPDIFIQFMVGVQSDLDFDPRFIITAEKSLTTASGEPNTNGPLKLFLYQDKKVPLKCQAQTVSPDILVELAHGILKGSSFFV